MPSTTSQMSGAQYFKAADIATGKIDIATSLSQIETKPAVASQTTH